MDIGLADRRLAAVLLAGMAAVLVAMTVSTIPGVRVDAGARVRDAVLFDDVTVEAGATVSRAIVDQRCRIGRGARVGSDDADLDDSDDITIVGNDAVIAPGAEVPKGARLEPGGTAD